MERLNNFMDGEYREPVGGEYLPNIEPATGKPFSQVADSDSRDVALAVAAASRAFQSWSVLTGEERGKILLRLADLIDQNLESLAKAESQDNGKTIAQARTLDIPRAAANFRFYGAAAMHFASESHVTGNEAVNFTLRQPLGPVACISPWNLPLYLFTWKIAPALAAGCTVVGKPSEFTPLTAYRLGQLANEAGLPKGVLNIVQGTGSKVGEPLVQHSDIRAISFTGGTATGRKIAQLVAPDFKKLSLELGGKNPTLIFADADFNQAVEETLRASFANQGEICLCGSRIFVERSIYDRFLEAFINRVNHLGVGDPQHETTRLGALVSQQHLQKVESYLELAVQEGGQILTGGKRIRPEGRCENGYFLSPAVITGLSPFCRTNQEEIFGPVVTVTPFDTEEEVITWSNSTSYGLAASLWTQNNARIHRMTAALQSGIIWVNCWLLRDLRTPFGGMKHSGIGREGGWESMKFFTEMKNVCIRYR